MSRRAAGTNSTEWFCSERQASCIVTSPSLESATEAYLVDVSIESSIKPIYSLDTLDLTASKTPA